MSTTRAATLALCLLVPAGAVHAQAGRFSGLPDTLTIARTDSSSNVHVRFVNTGAHVSFVGLPSQLSADTMDITAPVRIVLPRQPFSLTVTSAEGASVTMLHESDGPAERVHYRTTFYSPITIGRTVANGALMMSGAKAAMKTERIR